MRHDTDSGHTSRTPPERRAHSRFASCDAGTGNCARCAAASRDGHGFSPADGLGNPGSEVWMAVQEGPADHSRDQRRAASAEVLDEHADSGERQRPLRFVSAGRRPERHQAGSGVGRARCGLRLRSLGWSCAVRCRHPRDARYRRNWARRLSSYQCNERYRACPQ